ncbi:zinc-dependent alcohol dehydrogenase family protein [Paenalcaligenes suwonensis]|uniref:zinc-dependent alcohol dehydrogenase family protein n=1 Tax=Paenalcaligenes suwonensis TaxID=1202713 RepID=UPI0014076600|nr:NAD(P)-dependent alcohol dehydrogenase [Paenalcaligenes suwonensis]NHC62067.1 NAD(P)-dependent alcohol dehydrogenase [Paenalcaligenes suwonensis]
MNAIQLSYPGGFDSLTSVDLPQPSAPQAHEIQVQLHASSLNYHDLLVAKYTTEAQNGRIPLSDGAGIVTAVGAGVSEFKVGDQVVSCFFPTWQTGPGLLADFSTVPGDGIDGYARQYVNASVNAFTLAPTGYNHTESATLTTAGLTAWVALVEDGKIKAGDSVLLLGTGGVSIIALQLAKSMGAQVIITTSSHDKAIRLKELGADHVIHYPSTPEWGNRVLELTQGRGADIVVEVGGPGTLAQSIRAARIGGHIALIGVLTGFSGDIPTRELMAKRVSLQGVLVGSRSQQQDMVRALNQQSWRPILDKTFALTELSKAFAYQESGQHFGKIAISI